MISLTTQLTIDNILEQLESPISEAALLNIQDIFCSSDHSIINAKLFLNKTSGFLSPVSEIFQIGSDLESLADRRRIFFSNHKDPNHLTCCYNLTSDYLLLYNLTTHSSIKIPGNEFFNYYVCQINNTSVYVTQPFFVLQEEFASMSLHLINFSQFSNRIQNDYKTPENLLNTMSVATDALFKQPNLSYINIQKFYNEGSCLFKYVQHSEAGSFNQMIWDRFSNNIEIKERIEQLNNFAKGNKEDFEWHKALLKLKGNKN